MSRRKFTPIEGSKDKGKAPNRGKAPAKADDKKADEDKPVAPQSVNPKPVSPKSAIQKALTETAVSEKAVAKKPVAKNKAAKVNKAKVSKALSREIIMLYEAIEYGTDRVDHGAVASAVGIKKPAARMRHIRLMRAIRESLESAADPSDVPGPSSVAGPSNVNQLEQANGDASSNEGSLDKAHDNDSTSGYGGDRPDDMTDDDYYRDDSMDLDTHSDDSVHSAHADDAETSDNALEHDGSEVAGATVDGEETDGPNFDANLASPAN